MADLSILKAVGMDIDSMSPEHLAALETLDDSEVAALAAIRVKLNGGGEVEGFNFPQYAAPASEQANLSPTFVPTRPIFDPGSLAADGNFVW